MASWETIGSNWVPLETAISEGRVPKKAGAYAIRCIVRGRPRHIDRIWGTDKTGIIYFGETGSGAGLRGRVSEFYRAAEKGKAAHSGGKRYHRLRYEKREGYSLDNLEVKWVESESKKNAKRQQNKWLEEYASKFGELPPLNGQGG